MCILTRDEILLAVERGEIRIDPFDPDKVGPASVDLHLGRSFRIFEPARKIVRIDGTSDYRDLSEKVTVPEHETMLLMPGETVLGLTHERVSLPPSLCGWLEGRSRFARVGLLVHISASFMQPGIHNHQVLEMTNFGPNPLELVPGIPICQFIFQRTVGQAVYRGTWADQSSDDW
ncbi:MAG: dCTP deaminase [Deltaproteobacteria bacterium]|nr:dCTP deaminase [Deltaproteobacteria bacterium]